MHRFPREILFESMHTEEKIEAPKLIVTRYPGAGKSYGINTKFCLTF
jgi:hypothetical protein